MAYAIMRMAKLKTNSSIASVEAHMDRTRETPNADPEYKDYNIDMIKNRDALQRFEELTKDINIRSNAVRGIDVFMGASPEFFMNQSREERTQWIRDSGKWIIDTFGSENILRMKLHQDESTPHIQAIVVPRIYDEEKKKYKLSARHYLNGREKMSKLQTSYHDAVKHHGLERGLEGSRAKHTDIKDFYRAVETAKSHEMPKPKTFESKNKYHDRVQSEYRDMACKALNNDLSYIKEKNVHNVVDRLKSSNMRLRSENADMSRQILDLAKLTKLNPAITLEILKAKKILKTKQKTKEISHDRDR